MTSLDVGLPRTAVVGQAAVDYMERIMKCSELARVLDQDRFVIKIFYFILTPILD
jgi:hypothetical protein